jgi:hypothetical protein
MAPTKPQASGVVVITPDASKGDIKVVVPNPTVLSMEETNPHGSDLMVVAIIFDQYNGLVAKSGHFGGSATSTWWLAAVLIRRVVQFYFYFYFFAEGCKIILK